MNTKLHAVCLRAPRKAPPAVRDPADLLVGAELVTDPWVGQAFDGAREKALECGVTICLTVARGDPDIEIQAIERLSDQPLLGVIFSTALTRRVDVSLGMRRNRTVLVNSYHAIRPWDQTAGTVQANGQPEVPGCARATCCSHRLAPRPLTGAADGFGVR